MKKTLLFAASLVLASNAMASQVRMDSLQNSRTARQDFVDMFAQPSVMWSGEVADQVLFENESGGVIISGEGTRYGFYVGRQPSILSSPIWELNSLSLYPPPPPAFFTKAYVPVNVFYGMDSGSMKWGLSATVANSSQKNVPPEHEQQFMGVAAGVDGGNWRADLALGLGASVKDTTADKELKGRSSIRVQVEYDLNENWRLFVDSSQAEVEALNAGNLVANGKVSSTGLGAERRLNHGLFYGIRYNMAKVTTSVDKDTTSLPLYIGGEVEVADWLLLRGTWSQPLISTSKVGSGGTKTNTFGDSSTVTGGAGIKIGKSLVDVTTGVATAANTNFSAGSGGFFANVAYTYNF